MACRDVMLCVFAALFALSLDAVITMSMSAGPAEKSAPHQTEPQKPDLVARKKAKADIELKDILFILLSQDGPYHQKRSSEFQEQFHKQIEHHKQEAPELLLLNKRWPHPGSWTILPLVPDLNNSYHDKAWVFFCEEDTKINVPGLLGVLQRYDHSKELFIGRGLRDQEATIIHHFAHHENIDGFVYPDFAAGFALSLPLVTRLAERMADHPPSSDFTIDVKHELATYIWDQDRGVRLTEVKELCAGDQADHCVTTFPHRFPKCGPAISEDDLFIAVKTCGKYHKDRVQVVKNTWAKEAKHIEYYSDVEDKSIPTIDLKIPNTERGHCGKTLAILKRARTHPHISKKPWLIITDDDTILSVRRLRELLSCYDPSDAIHLGEKYAYAVAHHGYNYITGGGGMVFSQEAVIQLIDSDQCQCGSNEAPDDMTLGMCCQRLGIHITHSPLFHQARPADYSKGYLSHQRPVSFHKHWMVDPYQVYRDWLADGSKHDEL